MLGVAGLVLHQHPRQSATARCWTIRRSFKTKEESKLGVLEYILQPKMYPELYGNLYHKVRINYYPSRGDNKEGWDNIDIFGWCGYPMQIKVDFLCRDSILARPWCWICALLRPGPARRLVRSAGVALVLLQEPAGRAGLYPEHDLFIQHTKLKNTLRFLMGEEPDHPSRASEYYEYGKE
jgi:myo-inositol-1-phosphate synthase